MRKDAYWLISDGSNAPLDEVKDLRNVAEGIHTSIIEGISAIGSLMFWAAESENYEPEQAKKDMFKLGDMLTNIARLAAGARDAEDNLAGRLREKQQ